jgi:hypothetical protein
MQLSKPLKNCEKFGQKILRLLTFACSKKKKSVQYILTRVEMLGKTFLLLKYVLFLKSKYKYAPFDDKHGTSSLQNPHIANILQAVYEPQKSFHGAKTSSFYCEHCLVLGSNPGSPSPTQWILRAADKAGHKLGKTGCTNRE